MTFTQNQISGIPDILSAPRFATYLKHANNDKVAALRLYQWNVQISATLIVPLHLFEVTIRNAVVESLEAVHGVNWHICEGFTNTIPNSSIGYNPRKNLEYEAKKHSSMGKVVAELKFAFWQQMFTSRYDKRLWNEHLKRVFPYAPADMGISELRETLFTDILSIRNLRNRIAHHEPIFTKTIAQDYHNMMKLITWRNQYVAEWLEQIQGFTALLHLKPVVS